MASCPKTKVEKYKKGRSRGGIYTVPSGERCFLVTTKLTYIFCAGEKTISDAIRKGVACWSLDEETLITMRAKSVKFIGVLCKDNGDIYATHTANFFNRAKIVIHSKGKPGRRYMPLGSFRHRAGKMKI